MTPTTDSALDGPVTAAVTVAARDRVRFEFATATLAGDWSQPVASLTLGGELPARESLPLRFSPFHRAGGIEPVGAVNTLRRLGDAGSQAGRPHWIRRRRCAVRTNPLGLSRASPRP